MYERYSITQVKKIYTPEDAPMQYGITDDETRRDGDCYYMATCSTLDDAERIVRALRLADLVSVWDDGR